MLAYIKYCEKHDGEQQWGCSPMLSMTTNGRGLNMSGYDDYGDMLDYSEQSFGYDEPYSWLEQALLSSIKGERSGVAEYSRLARMAPSPEIREIIQGIANDERKHERMFTENYQRLFGREPWVTPEPPSMTSFEEGVMEAIQDEMKDAAKYRDLYLRTRDPRTRTAFFIAMIDELRHGSLLNSVLVSLMLRHPEQMGFVTVDKEK